MMEGSLILLWIVGSIPHGGPIDCSISSVKKVVVCTTMYVGKCICKIPSNQKE